VPDTGGKSDPDNSVWRAGLEFNLTDILVTLITPITCQGVAGAEVMENSRTRNLGEILGSGEECPEPESVPRSPR